MAKENRNRATKAVRLLALAVGIGVVAAAPIPSDIASAQSTLQSTKFKNEPRLRDLRVKLQRSRTGAVRPLTFEINESWESSSDNQAKALAQRFILDLGGTPVKRGAQFELRLEYIGNTQSPDGIVQISDFIATIRDNQARGSDLLAQSELSVRCRAVPCSPSSAQVKDLLLRLGE